jgi:stage IV sporulation protein B
VAIGPAEILTVVDGEEIASYRIEIEKLAYQTRPSDKGIIVRVVDKELIERTGGIVQGMSGSPIIQNGRLVGAITHVLVNDPTRGYGIFMEWMHQEAEILTNN